MAAAEVDVAFLATQVNLPELDIGMAVTAPTPESVCAILSAVVLRFRDLEQEKFQLSIELEGAYRNGESRAEQANATRDKALKDLEEARQKAQNEESLKRSLENKNHALESFLASEKSENETLRTRITSLEMSNRETLSVVDTKTQANASLAEELQRQHQKLLKLNQEITSLNQSVQVAQATANSAKYREEALRQELELAKKNNEWFDNELKTKNTEALKFRKEKNARIAELQRQNEDSTSTIESLTRNEQLLRKRLEEAQAKAEEALSKVQQLQEAAARAEESFKQELESSRRLVELKDQQSQTHRNRLKEVELRLEQVKDDSSSEIRRIRQELEQEKQDHRQAEQNAQELQSEIDRLKVMMESREAPGSVPQTPRQNGTLFRPGSPFGTPGSLLGKSTMRASDALEELYTVKGQLAGERRRNKKLQEDLDDAVTMLEAKLPEIDELTAESERLRSEAIQMSEIMQQSYEERDAAIKTARKAESAASTAQSEAKILRTQLRDLSTQIRVLIFNIHAQEKGLDRLTEEESAEFERIQRGELAEGTLEDMSDTHQFITQKFVVFKDIYELQEKNQELLRVTRELADKMENEEAIAAKQLAAQDHHDVEELRNTVSLLQDEVKSLTVRMKSYMTERDMFRRMLQQKATPAEINAALGISAEAGQRQVLASIEQNMSVDEADLATALRELQAQFDSYRNDQTTDRNSLKDQIERLSAEKSSLQNDIARVSSQLTLATERYSILESNFKAAQAEKQELQKRNQSLSESAAKQDIRTQQVAEDLVQTKGLLEALRTENARLKAEKTMVDGMRERISQDRDSLAEEKTRLSNLLTKQQTLLNEQQLSESDNRRRFQSQIDNLDAELATTRRKLTEEVEEAKKIQLRKEFDAQQFQKRIDELTSTISQIKEESVAVKTTRDHLQARVNELEVELKNAQERADRLRPIPTSRSQFGTAAEPDADLVARIEELENEVAELRSERDVAIQNLESEAQKSEHFQQLARSLEEDLESARESHTQFSQEMDAQVLAKDNRLAELERSVEDLTAELSSRTRELNLERDSHADIARKTEEKERILNSEIARLKEEEERSKEASRFHQQDLRAQAEIATKAQQDYEQELVRHAEAAKLLQQIRAEHNQLKTESATWKAEAESARIALAQSEQSWEERRQQLQQEIHEIQTRRDDINAQNKLLHQQLESITAQIATLQQSRVQADASSDSPMAADTAAEGLRELNNYLRREKEILEVQYDLKVQETKRLQQQTEYLQSQLDETRLALDQQRQSDADSARNSLTHKELMDKLNELNLIRESNVTLRNENQRTHAQLEEKTAKIVELEARIQPLEARIAELELDKTFQDAEIKQLQEARDGLQKRIESILSKYGQADHQEVEQLKATVAELEAERDTLKASEQALQEKVKEAETTLETERGKWTSTRERLTDDFKTRFRNMKTQRDDFASEKTGLQANLEATTERLTTVEKELEATKIELSSLEEKNKLLVQQAAAPAVDQQPATPDLGSGEQVVVQDPKLVQQLEDLKRQLEDVTSQKAAVDAELEELRMELATALSERDEARERAAQQPVNGADTDMQGAANAEQAEHVSTAAGISDEERKVYEDKIAAAEAKAAECEAKAKELEEHADSIVKQRSEKMKSALNKKLAESKEELQKQVQAEKEELQKQFDLKLQQELAIIKAEQQTSGPQNGAPSTPAKPVDTQAPQTPVVGTPGLGDLSNLTDAQTRELLSSNPTVMSIVKSNVKKLAAVEAKKARDELEVTIKAEYDQKIISAKEQATALSEKKSALRINMLDRQSKTAQAKIAVVETAAKETPQRPVVEVWEIAKDAKPPTPAVTPAPTPAPAATAVLPASAAAPAATQPAVSRDTPQTTAPAATTEENKQPPSVIPSGVPVPAKPVTATSIPNPFGQPQQPVVNPFGQPPAAAAAGQPVQGQQPPRTGIPVPRGGAAGGRGGRGTYQVGQGRGQGQRGRGGFGRGGAQGGLNPGAGEFSPAGAGNKRPREDGGANAGGTGAKRPRGGGSTGSQ